MRDKHQGLGFRVQVLGFRVEGLRIRVWRGGDGVYETGKDSGGPSLCRLGVKG